MSRTIPLLLLLLSACAPDLREAFPFDGASRTGGSRITHEDQGGGLTYTLIDASEKEAWVYLDLDSKQELPVDEALSGQTWDLAFQRFKIISNGGVSGPGSAEVAAIEGRSFESIQVTPASGFRADAPDGSDSNSDVDSAFLEGDGWYYYDLAKHRLTARDIVYVVRTGEGRAYKLQLLDYYDDAGSSARPSFQWAEVANEG